MRADALKSHGQNDAKFVAITFRITGQAPFKLDGVSLFCFVCALHLSELSGNQANVFVIV